jgi:molecular chaperone HscB
VRLRRIVQRLIDFSQDYFALFGLPRRYRFNRGELETLDAAYRSLQRDIHPDRHAVAGEVERRLALQSSARVNEAYRALKDPVSRAQYLLSLHGIDALGETDTALEAGFLQRELERRETVAEAHAAQDAPRLASLLDTVRSDIVSAQAALGERFDAGGDLAPARDAVRELRFLTKVAADIEAALADVEA